MLPDAVRCEPVLGPLDLRRTLADRLLELLEPWAGHRARVVRLLGCAGIQAPKRGPSVALRSIRDL